MLHYDTSASPVDASGDATAVVPGVEGAAWRPVPSPALDDLRAVWGAEYSQDTHILRTYINQLRAKLGDDSAAPRYIRTDAGVGYRFLDPES